MPTRKEYLAGLNPPLAKLGKGRISKAGLAEIERAKASGLSFSDDGGQVSGSDDPDTSTVDQTPYVYVPEPIPDKPKLRDISVMTGYTREGYKVESAHCMRCTYHVSVCDCRGGVWPSKIVARWDETVSQYGQPLDAIVSI